LALGAFGFLGSAAAAGGGPGMSADAALKDILSGNATYQKNEMLAKRRAETAQSQAPQAIIVSCSDSRVPPEGVFNRYIGRLFVVRTAGHALGDYELASIEYAVEHLKSPLIVVMGHERCGAVKATVEAATGGGGGGGGHSAATPHEAASPGGHDDHAAPKKATPPPKDTPAPRKVKDKDKHDDHGGGHHRPTHGALEDDTFQGACDAPAKGAAPGPVHDHIASLVKELTPAVVEAKKANPGDLLDAAVRENSKRVARQLVRESGVLRDAVETGALKIVAARYDLDTGAVEVLE
jgi:carbonic anhydrase